MKKITMRDFADKKFDITSKSPKALTYLILGIPLFHNSIADCLKKNINPSEIIKDQVNFFDYTEEQFNFFESWYMSLWGNSQTISQFPTSEDAENLNTEGFTFNPYNHVF